MLYCFRTDSSPTGNPIRSASQRAGSRTAGVRGRPPHGRDLPAPKGSEAGTVPADQRLRPYDLQSVQHLGSQAIKPNKQ